MGQLCESCSRGRWSASCRAQRARNYGKNAHKLSLFVSVFLRFTCEILLGSTNQINPKINCAMIHKGLWLVKFAACIGECTLTLLNIAIVKKCTVFFLFKGAIYVDPNVLTFFLNYLHEISFNPKVLS